MIARLALALALIMPWTGLAPADAGWPADRKLAPVRQAQPAEGDSLTGPAMFVENVGQWDAAAGFRSLGGQTTVWLAEDAVWIAVAGRENRAVEEISGEREGERVYRRAGEARVVNLRLTFPGANPQVELAPEGRRATHVSFFLGDRPSGWAADVGAWDEVRYVNIYPGIDLVVGSAADAPLRWRLEARPGADLAAVRLAVAGADRLQLRESGLAASTPLGDVVLPLIRVAPEPASEPPALAGAVVTRPFLAVPEAATSAAAPAAGASDLLYGTFIGGRSGDQGLAVAHAADGSATFAGATLSPDFPAQPGAADVTYAGAHDLFVVRLDAAGSRLLHATYLGGSADESNDGGYPIVDLGLALDAAGNAYLTGFTDSGDFPTTTGAYDRSLGGTRDAFAVKLNATGSALIYSTYLGGSARDLGRSIALDGAGNAFIAGYAESADFPTTAGAYDRSGQQDGFVAVLNAAGSGLIAATYLGGAQAADAIAGLSLGADGSVYLAGHTASEDFPTTDGAFAATCQFGGLDAFAAVLTPDLGRLRYATCLGGSQDDAAQALALDTTGGMLVAGSTASTDFPATAGAADASFNGGRDGFIARLMPAGAGAADLVYATFLGGEGWDELHALAADAGGAAVAAGVTGSADFPVTAEAYGTLRGGHTDGYLTKVHPNGRSLVYSTFLGGSEGASVDEYVRGLAVEAGRGYATVTGSTNSGDFPTTPGAYDRTLGFSGGDAFAARLALPAAGVDAFVSSPAEVVAPVGGQTSMPVTYGNRGITTASDALLTATLHSGLVFVSDSSGLPPIISGSQVSWQLGSLASRATGGFVLRVRPRGASAYVRYPVTLGISSAGPEERPLDNTSRTEVLALIAPEAVVLSGPAEGLAAADIAFTAAVTPDTASLPFTYTWEATGQAAETHVGRLLDSITYNWEAPISAVITVTATNPAGSVSSSHRVTIVPPVQASFTAAPAAGPLPLRTVFTNTSAGRFTRSRWDFGDGGTSDERDPTHVYHVTGAYTVTLEVSGPDGFDTARRPELILVARGRTFVPLVLAEE